ncbi:ribosome-binding factor A [Desulfurobacterium thermolithotrophum DSM 11699]|uniref:Ribosome-binding factor A n=1 Tax=Desulfurobacterium thermolithotrophum (strain DSM 11699 / BSA) TaxID=868864 RepID=F0S400_DESTD|nr:30S ribosome-binding factor RbfA [Desulfurobacterium thermolithotrophum]ADY73572.1 ribosome-binding factor A [Desulfurobacterium thermolithotrophum DSM 11699]
MRERRRERLKSLLIRELSDILRIEIDLPDNAFVTIHDVHLSKDGSKVTVFISALKKEDAIKAVEILNKATGYIHHILGKRLKLKVVPRPEFVISPGDLL